MSQAWGGCWEGLRNPTFKLYGLEGFQSIGDLWMSCGCLSSELQEFELYLTCSMHEGCRVLIFNVFCPHTMKEWPASFAFHTACLQVSARWWHCGAGRARSGWRVLSWGVAAVMSGQVVRHHELSRDQKHSLRLKRHCSRSKLTEICEICPNKGRLSDRHVFDMNRRRKKIIIPPGFIDFGLMLLRATSLRTTQWYGMVISSTNHT